MFSSNRNRRAVCAAALLGLLIPARDAQAATDTWKTAANGTWGLNASWTDNSVPTGNDFVVFNLAGIYTASFNAQPAAIQALTVTGSGVNVRFQTADAASKGQVKGTFYFYGYEL